MPLKLFWDEISLPQEFLILKSQAKLVRGKSCCKMLVVKTLEICVSLNFIALHIKYQKFSLFRAATSYWQDVTSSSSE